MIGDSLAVMWLLLSALLHSGTSIVEMHLIGFVYLSKFIAVGFLFDAVLLPPKQLKCRQWRHDDRSVYPPSVRAAAPLHLYNMLERGASVICIIRRGLISV